MSAAHDKVRVTQALPRLPKISEALRTGAVSYSKVRAMTRVATPENEDHLLELARHGTASHMELIVRGYRRATGDAEAAHANERHRARSLRYYRDPNDGCIVLEARLPVDESLNAELDIDERTNRCLWDDVRVDLGMAVGALIQRDRRLGVGRRGPAGLRA